MANYSHIPFVCLDTNIVISLAMLERGDARDIKELDANGCLSSLHRINILIKSEKIIPIITTTVLREIVQGVGYYGTNTCDYLRSNNIYVLELNHNKKKSYYNLVEKLACQYCTPIKHNTIQQIAQFNHTNASSIASCVFKFIRENKSRREVPINDARVMAQCAVLGIPLITNDYKDFINYNRRDVISFINSKNKLQAGALPYTSYEILQYIARRSTFFSVSKEHASQIHPASECELLK